MNISRVWKWIVGMVGTIGVLVSGAKSAQEIWSTVWRSLNPWVFSFCLFALMLGALGVNEWRERLEKRFAQTNALIKALSGVIQDKEIEVGKLRNELAQVVQASEKPKQIA